MYAVIETGGKQHKVEKGTIILVDLLKEESGKKVTFDNVLLYVDGDNVEIGQLIFKMLKLPLKLKILLKLIRFQYYVSEERKHSMRKIGHRAKHSQVEIKNIKLESK